MTLSISIITPVYNGEEFIRETILSVINCLGENIAYEYLVINDGSNDGTFKILQEFQTIDRIKIIHRENHGEPATVNYGLELARGEFVIIVNADDPMLSKDLIPRALSILENSPQVVCVYPDWQVIDAEGKLVRTNVVDEYSELELIGKFNCLPGPGAVFRRNSALVIGGRNSWRFVSDYDFWLRLSRLGEFKRIPGVLAQWRSHQNSTTISMKNLEMARERIAVIENFLVSNILGEEISKMSLGSAYYFAARLGVFAPDIPAKKWMITSFQKSKRWPEVANPLVVIFIFALPFSRYLLKLITPYSKRLRGIF